MAIELLNMDCKDLLNRSRDKEFSLIIPDPPYGIDGNSHRKNKNRVRLAGSKDYHMALWDQGVPDDDYFNLVFEKSQQQVIFGGNYFKQLGDPYDTPRRANIDQWLKNYPKGWIAWDKCNGTTGFNDYELIWTSFSHMNSFVFQYMWNGFMQGMRIEKGYLQQPHKKYNEVRIHPAHKPVNLYKFLYRQFSGWTQNVLDTHLGSGSSAIAAHDMGIKFTGTEIDNTYYNLATKRYNQQIAQLKLL